MGPLLHRAAIKKEEDDEGDEEEKERRRNTGQKYNVLPYYIWRP